MVVLTMTPALVALLRRHPELQSNPDFQKSSGDPSLLTPEEGNPISHGQIIDIYRHLRKGPTASDERIRLPDLLKSADVYKPPAEPKQEPTSEYKQLMARLRRDDESRAYHKMLNSSSDYKNPFQKFAAPDSAATWDLDSSVDQVDDLRMSDVNRQVALIINVLVSIMACGIAVWLLSRGWPAPARLALSMICGATVGIAEVVLYAAYVRKVGEARSLEKSKPEQRSITDTWVIEKSKEPPVATNIDHQNLETSGNAGEKDRLRRRKPNTSGKIA